MNTELQFIRRGFVLFLVLVTATTARSDDSVFEPSDFPQISV